MTKQFNLITVKPEIFGFTVAQFFVGLLEQCETRLPLVTLPTGNTPASFYAALLTYDDVPPFRYLQLDEYVGLDKHDNRLFSSWLDRDILAPLGMNHSQRILFQSDAPDINNEIDLIRRRLDDTGPIDIAVLGIGTNGHIAFNEPQLTPFTDDIRVADLTEETRRANAKYWGCRVEEMPTKGYTLGIPLLSQARQTVLLATGADKAEILRKTFKDPISPTIPSTYLQTIENVTVITDEAAASLL